MPDRAKESLDKSQSTYIHAAVCYGSKILDDVNKPSISYRISIEAGRAYLHAIISVKQHLDFYKKNEQKKSFDQRKALFLKNAEANAIKVLNKIKGQMEIVNAKIVSKKFENGKWTPNPVKYSNSGDYETNLKMDLEKPSLGLDPADLFKPRTAAEKLAKSSSETMINAAKAKGHDNGMVKEIINQYLITVLAVVIAVNLAAWFIKTYASLTTVSIWEIKEFGFA